MVSAPPHLSGVLQDKSACNRREAAIRGVSIGLYQSDKNNPLERRDVHAILPNPQLHSVLHNLIAHREEHVSESLGEEDDVHEGRDGVVDAYHPSNQEHRHIRETLVTCAIIRLSGLSPQAVQDD